jgi:hypothetical protein
MKPNYRLRRFVVLLIVAIVSLTGFAANTALNHSAEPLDKPQVSHEDHTQVQENDATLASSLLANLSVKGRAPKTDYARTQFSNGWERVGGCDLRNIILRRDLENVITNEKCQVVSGTLDDPYTGKMIEFQRGEDTSDDVQIDHVVALSDAWQTGAQQLSAQKRMAFANDPLNLLAVDGKTNQQKSDGNAASWLPPNKAFRCQYVARQIAVKAAYQLWVLPAEFDAMKNVLAVCPNQKLPTF